MKTMYIIFAVSIFKTIQLIKMCALLTWKCLYVNKCVIVSQYIGSEYLSA